MIFKPLVDLFAKAFSLTRDLQENKDAIKDLRAELDETNQALQRLATEVRILAERDMQSRERQKLEREQLKLELENVLLRSKQLKPGRKKRS